MNNQYKMFSDGYKIVYRRMEKNSPIAQNFEETYTEGEEYEWLRLENEITCKVYTIT